MHIYMTMTYIYIYIYIYIRNAFNKFPDWILRLVVIPRLKCPVYPIIKLILVEYIYIYRERGGREKERKEQVSKKKRGVFCVTLSKIWWWGSSSGFLRNEENPFIAFTTVSLGLWDFSFWYLGNVDHFFIAFNLRFNFMVRF